MTNEQQIDRGRSHRHPRRRPKASREGEGERERRQNPAAGEPDPARLRSRHDRRVRRLPHVMATERLRLRPPQPLPVHGDDRSGHGGAGSAHIYTGETPPAIFSESASEHRRGFARRREGMQRAELPSSLRSVGIPASSSGGGRTESALGWSLWRRWLEPPDRPRGRATRASFGVASTSLFYLLDY